MTYEEEDTLNIADVARMVDKTVNTVKYDMSRNPERVPPWFKLPGSRKPLWLKSSVIGFLKSQAAKQGALVTFRGRV